MEQEELKKTLYEKIYNDIVIELKNRLPEFISFDNENNKIIISSIVLFKGKIIKY